MGMIELVLYMSPHECTHVVLETAQLFRADGGQHGRDVV